MAHSSPARSRVYRAILPAAAGAALVGTAAIPTHAASSSQTFRTLASSNQFFSAHDPSQIADAYDFTTLYNKNITGVGQSVALIEIGNAPTSDLQQFDQRFNLPAPSIKQYWVGGKKFTTKSSGETAMDIEWLHALAPGAKIQVYYLKGQKVSRAGWQGIASAVTSATANGAKTISMSIGTCGPSSGWKSAAKAFAAAEAKEVSTFVSSGDSGDHPGSKSDCGDQVGVAYPASDPSVVAVGGTSLQLNEDNTIASETAWDLSGGGLVQNLTRPTWQSATGLPAGASRGVPDVSFIGDPSTGVAMVYKGRWDQSGGTSLGAPAWAAAWALIRQSAAQAGVQPAAAPPTLYKLAGTSQYTTLFHDITTGSNGIYSAGPGWDPVTGLGTPDVANIAGAISTLP